jgi:oxygen-dependent protoporphyrinogen oxidase
MLNAWQSDKPRDVIIIGGGITGLSAAWAMQQHDDPPRYALLEGDARWGGKIVTARLTTPEGSTFLMDGGPESFVTRKPEVYALAKALGVPTTPASETRGMYVLDAGQMRPIPLGPLAFATSRLISPSGKLRMLAEPSIPARRDNADESLADFVRRRLGKEALRKLFGPVLGGIYNADPERQSILVASPLLREMERAHGSLFRAVVAQMRAARKRKSKGTPPPRFIAFRDGAASLVEALVSRLTGELRLGARVIAVEREGDHYAARLASGETLRALALVITTLPHVAGDLLAPLAPAAAAGLGHIQHTSIGTATLAFPATALPLARAARLTGLMIPRREQRALDAVQWTSARMPERAPQGYALIRVFFGGGQPQMVSYDDETLLGVIRRELAALFGIDAPSVAFCAFRWPEGYPVAEVGHLERVAQIEAALPPGVFLAGSAYRGVGVPDCIRQGQEAARQVQGWLAAPSASAPRPA